MPASKDQRKRNEIRPVRIKRRFTKSAPGSVLYQSGETVVLCTASLSDSRPPWMTEPGRGWLTAEYNMLPGSTAPRKPRERQKLDGRTTEIQRLIGRSLRAVVDLTQIGERTLTIDCDVLQADGGTRTASITGAFIAAVDAVHSIPELRKASHMCFRDSVAAISVGIVDGKPTLDLDYVQDFAATVDMNVVMTGAGKFVEVQGTGEEATFERRELNALLDLAAEGVKELTSIQQKTFGTKWPI